MFGDFKKKFSLGLYITFLVCSVFYQGCNLTRVSDYKYQPLKKYHSLLEGSGEVVTTRPVLMVFDVDDSGSMGPFQAKLTAAALEFVNEIKRIYEEDGVLLDITVAITKTSMWEDHDNEAAFLFDEGQNLFRSKVNGQFNPAFVSDLPAKLSVGTSGTGNELLYPPLIDMMRYNFKEGSVNPFFPPFAQGQASVVFVMMSDETDQSVAMDLNTYDFVEAPSYTAVNVNGNDLCPRSIMIEYLGMNYDYKLANCPLHELQQQDDFVFLNDRVLAKYNNWTNPVERAFDVANFALAIDGSSADALRNSSLYYIRQGEGSGGVATIPTPPNPLSANDVNAGRYNDTWSAQENADAVKTVSNAYAIPNPDSASRAYDLDQASYLEFLNYQITNNYRVVNGFKLDPIVDMNEPYTFSILKENGEKRVLAYGSEYQLDKGVIKGEVLTFSQSIYDLIEAASTTANPYTALEADYTPADNSALNNQGATAKVSGK